MAPQPDTIMSSERAYGYFDAQQHEYVITEPLTPLPWINYLGSKALYSIISNTGGGYSFYRDAKLRRLTRYRYDSVPARFRRQVPVHRRRRLAPGIPGSGRRARLWTTTNAVMDSATRVSARPRTACARTCSCSLRTMPTWSFRYSS